MTDESTAWETIHTFDAFPDLKERPRLFLGLREVDRPPSGFRPGREWRRLQHQTAGLACQQVILLATELTPRPEIEALLLRLSQRFYDSGLSTWGLTLDEALLYRQALQELLSVDCNDSFKDLHEGLYPVDVSTEHLQHLALDELPADLNDLLEFSDRWDAVMGMLNRWRLFIIAQNSD